MQFSDSKFDTFETLPNEALCAYFSSISRELQMYNIKALIWNDFHFISCLRLVFYMRGFKVLFSCKSPFFFLWLNVLHVWYERGDSCIFHSWDVFLTFEKGMWVCFTNTHGLVRWCLVHIKWHHEIYQC